jgi:PAS domain S-box-containing protein
MAGRATYRENLPLTMNRKGFVEETWFTFSYSPVRDESGAVAGMFCAVAETTHQILAEAKLSHSEARFRSLADAMPQLVWTADADGRVDYFNARRQRYLGINERAGGDWNWIPLVHPDDRARTQEAWAAALVTGEQYACEHRLALNDGGWAWHVSRAECVRDPSGGIGKWYGTAIDISELKAAQQAAEALNATLERRIEEALAERRLLADIVEGTDAFVQVSDLDYRWLAINKSAADEFERIFGVRPKVGDNMLAVLADQPEHQRAVEAIWSRALAGEQFTEVDEFGDPNRDRRAYEMKFNTLRDAEGRCIGAYQFVYDVTERLKDQARYAEAQEHLRQAQKMETIGQLTGGVAHDFNNLLTPIVGALDILRRSPDSDDRAQRLATRALQAAERARLLINRLLAFSRRQHLQPRSVDVRMLVASLGDLVSRSLGPRIELVLRIPEDLPAALVDPNQLELALLNLAVNGRDAMSGDGKLTVTASLREVDKHSKLKPGSYICLTVSDTGVGMDEETLRRATEPFFTTKDVGHGTGLGLSSVLGLAEQSGGSFELESRPGRGTTGKLWLPVSDKAPAESASDNEGEFTPIQVNATPVLLVDDEEIVRVGTAEMLVEAGYSVTQASSGYEALRFLRDGLEATALVTDFAMPGMTGVELAREALALRPKLQVLLITGYVAVTDQDAGGLRRLAKPFRQADLARAVGDLLSIRKVIRLAPRSISTSIA